MDVSSHIVIGKAVDDDAGMDRDDRISNVLDTLRIDGLRSEWG